MRVCVLAGGIGSARFCAGLSAVVDPSELVIVVNVGDDDRMRGLYVCPDIDSVLYHLAGVADWERGWGVAEESYTVHERYAELVERAGEVGADLHEWFTLGDRDLATNLLRTRLLDAGAPLSVSVDAVRRGLGVGPRVLPATDAPLRTVVVTAEGDRLDFQTYFVRRRHADAISEIAFVGTEDAVPAPGVADAVEGAEVVILPPSNPLISIGPVLAIAELRRAVEQARCPRVAVSPIVGGKALKGPAGALLASLGHEVSALGVARTYRGLVDVFVLDAVDASLADDIGALGMRPVVLDTIMSGPESAARLAKEVLDAVA